MTKPDAQGVLAGSKDASRCIGYLTKYLTKHVGDCHQASKTLADHRADRKAWLTGMLGLPATDPTRYTWEPVNPVTPTTCPTVSDSCTSSLIASNGKPPSNKRADEPLIKPHPIPRQLAGRHERWQARNVRAAAYGGRSRRDASHIRTLSAAADRRAPYPLYPYRAACPHTRVRVA